MHYEKRLEAYEKQGKMDEHARRRIKLKAFLDKHVYLRDALTSYAYEHASSGLDEADKEALYIAQAIMPALIKEGLEPASEEEYLQAVLDFKNKEDA